MMHAPPSDPVETCPGTPRMSHAPPHRSAASRNPRWPPPPSPLHQLRAASLPATPVCARVCSSRTAARPFFRTFLTLRLLQPHRPRFSSGSHLAITWRVKGTPLRVVTVTSLGNWTVSRRWLAHTGGQCSNCPITKTVILSRVTGRRVLYSPGDHTDTPTSGYLFLMGSW